jgi:hypothetical protein
MYARALLPAIALVSCVACGSAPPTPPNQGVYGQLSLGGGDTPFSSGSSPAKGEKVCAASASLGANDPAPTCVTSDANGNYTIELALGSYVVCWRGVCDKCVSTIAAQSRIRRDATSGQAGAVFAGCP